MTLSKASRNHRLSAIAALSPLMTIALATIARPASAVQINFECSSLVGRTELTIEESAKLKTSLIATVTSINENFLNLILLPRDISITITPADNWVKGFDGKPVQGLADFSASFSNEITAPERITSFFENSHAEAKAEFKTAIAKQDLSIIRPNWARAVIERGAELSFLKSSKDFETGLYLGIFSHEYGHILFHENFFNWARDNPLSVAFNHVLDLRIEYEQSKSAERIEQIKNDFKKPHYDFNLRFFEDHVLAYSELFADLIALYQSNQPQIIADFMTYYAPLSGPLRDNFIFMKETRNFENNLDYKSLNRVEAGLMNGIHEHFAPFRKWFYQKHYAPAASREEKAKLLRLVLQASFAEIGATFNQLAARPDPYEIPHVSFEASNIQLQNRFIELSTQK